MLRSTKVALTGFELTSHTTVGRAGYPLNHPVDGYDDVNNSQNSPGYLYKGLPHTWVRVRTSYISYRTVGQGYESLTELTKLVG